MQDESWIASPAARNDGGLARNDPGSSHCEEQSDVAIYFTGGAGRQMDCFAFGSQWRWGVARNDSGRLAMTPIPVIARSKATWQSIFQVVKDDRWVASLLNWRVGDFDILCISFDYFRFFGSIGGNMLAIRLPQEIEVRLEALAKLTGRTKTFFAREALLTI